MIRGSELAATGGSSTRGPASLNDRETWRRLEPPSQRALLGRLYEGIRAASVELCQPLVAEDFCLQAVKETSPPKWHLAHTTWFFETFLLQPFLPDYKDFHPAFQHLFNSYYNAVGEQFARPMRGLLTRPTIDEVMAYRASVDQSINQLIDTCDQENLPAVSKLLELGCNHEEQHQELLLTDLKYSFSLNPIKPVYQSAPSDVANDDAGSTVRSSQWWEYQGGLCEVGHTGSGFSFDNEHPRHKVYLEPYRLSPWLVTNGEFLAFIEAGGYDRPEFWLSDGFAEATAQGWKHPLYWRLVNGRWYEFTLSGERPVNMNEPVTHVSFYEADAYARFCGKRLPTEAEWELAAETVPVEGNLRESGRLHPAPADGVNPLFGDTWEWTASSYSPYPGYEPEAGAVGEYNGKFMINQMVLRGGSCVTPAGHIRASYRNFFYPPDRWQFTGIRLAEGIRQ
ncbi:ergothioneine biosynthesis protein EgtB [Marinimicrobium agarilyticum]|uniref:ergothioneine biosynthesis protein EgtB n=1 Tax=Marinimicrobium agarilyticum TaxID=306546 RepID=UPI0009FDB07C|nr:ergothioneine biosynthesis protein EgtB [Marinimicrobium agarilyticum]